MLNSLTGSPLPKVVVISDGKGADYFQLVALPPATSTPYTPSYIVKGSHPNAAKCLVVLGSKNRLSLEQLYWWKGNNYIASWVNMGSSQNREESAWHWGVLSVFSLLPGREPPFAYRAVMILEYRVAEPVLGR